MTGPAAVDVAARPSRRSPVTGGIVGKAAELATLALLSVVVPRLLGPSDYGWFTVVLTTVTIGTTALALGGTPLLSRFVPAAPPAERLGLARALGVRLAVSRLGQVAVLALAAAVLVVRDPSSFPPVTVALTTVALAANVAATLALQVGLGLGRTGPWNARYPVQNAVLVLAVLVLYPLAGRTGAVWAVVVAAGAGVAAGVVAARGVLGAARTGPTPPLPVGALRFGRQQGAGWALLQVSLRGGVLAVALLVGAGAQVGFAGLATGVAAAVVHAVLQLFIVSLPGLADGSGATPSVGAGEAALRRLTGRILAVLLPASLVAAVALPRAVPLVFGDAYAAAADVFVPMVALVVLSPVLGLVLQSAALRTRAEATLTGAAAGAAAFLLASGLLVPGRAALGAAIATLAGVAVTVAVTGRALPGAVGWRLGGLAVAGASGVVVVGALA